MRGCSEPKQKLIAKADDPHALKGGEQNDELLLLLRLWLHELHGKRLLQALPEPSERLLVGVASRLLLMQD